MRVYGIRAYKDSIIQYRTIFEKKTRIITIKSFVATLGIMYDLYVVTDDSMSHGRTHAEVAELAFAGGADAVQLRMKNSDEKEMLEQALLISESSKKYGKLFFVNDNFSVALKSGADGVHFGQSDMHITEARKICGKDMLIGISAGTLEEALDAEKFGADYIGFGPVFDTSSKSDAPSGIGLELLKEVCKKVKIPVVAIGGINESNTESVLKAGAEGLAVISVVVAKEDIKSATTKMKTLIDAIKSQ